jgi:hypothetical protein
MPLEPEKLKYVEQSGACNKTVSCPLLDSSFGRRGLVRLETLLTKEILCPLACLGSTKHS